ncbi:MAG TPA: hypothetical protein VLA23_13865 [Candidatus Limnocylindrales bacterium]|nr:hypothetical protein [Candidatus Limnocylindrales bacterium]
MDERFAREVRLNLAEHLDPVRGEHAAWASSPAAAAVASPARHQAGPGRYWLLVAAAIAAVTLATTILLAGGFRLPDLPTPPWLLSESPTPTTDPNVFSWARDDLLDWVTDDEMTQALVALSMRRPFGAELVGDVVSDCDLQGNLKTGLKEPECEWRFRLAGDAESWRLGVHNGDHDGDGVPDGGPWRTHSWLPEGATHAEGEGFAYGSFLFSGPGSEESICITLGPPGVDWGDLDPNEFGFKARVFALASMMLRELGWAD